jgi:transposase
MNELMQWIGKVVVGGGVLTYIAYNIFKLLASKWLDEKFNQRLAAYKHEQQKEIEHLRFKINALLDRTIKLHQREFEVLPEAWALLNDAFWATNAFVSPLQQYPDLDKLNPIQLDEFLKSCEFTSSEKDELKNESDKTSYYSKRIFWYRLQKVRKTVRDAHIYFLKNGIFLQPLLREKFKELDDMIWDALFEREQSEEHPGMSRKFTKEQILRKDGEKLLKELEIYVRNRLCNTEPISI